VTTGSGTYLFTRLLPGLYEVEASMTNLGTSKREVRVAVDVDTQVELTLSPSAAESVTVVAEAPAVDMRSTEVNVNFTAEVIRNLPLDRSYRGLFQLIPGVADNLSTIGPAAGGSRQDNVYLIDGVNITNPGFGFLQSEVNELDIAEFNIKRGAISAEFGRAAGVVTNAVSRSGTNQFAGIARFDFMPESFIGDYDDARFVDPVTSVVKPAIGVGGPIVKNKVFGYASALYVKQTLFDRLNRAGQALPDEEDSAREWNAKVTATPSSRHLVTLGYRYRPRDIENDSLTTGDSASLAQDATFRTHIATASWSFFPTDRTTLDLKLLYLKDDASSDPVTQLAAFPTFDPTRLAEMGQYFDQAQNLNVGGFQYANVQNYRRNEARVTVGQFFDLGGTGHQVKAGVGYEFGEEELDRLANGWGELVSVTVSGQARIRARYYHDQPPQLGQGRTWSAFVQDTVTIGRRFSLNAGLLLNKDEFAQDLPGSGGCPATITLKGGNAPYESKDDRCTFVRFGFGDQVQPRLGINYNLRAEKGDKLYANWGRYYNTDQKSSGRSLAPRRIFQKEAFFNAATGALISVGDRPSTTGKLIDPDLEPTYNDEWLAGYATPIGSKWAVDLYYQYRNTENFIEDVPSALPATGPYAAANLPCARFAACQGVEAERKYQAVTVELNRRMADRFSLHASYTWSRFEGNIDYDYLTNEAVFNTSSLIQDGPGTNVQEPLRDGPLRQDRPHVLKLFANYMPLDALMLGAFVRMQSGTPWNARGRDSQSSTAYLNYLEPAGTNRNPTWTNVDFLASYRFKLRESTAVTVEARVLNLFDAQTQTSTDVRKFLDFNSIPVPPYIGEYRQANPTFGTPNGLAPPRRFLAAVLVDF
jgi:hypothetical protein